MLRGPEITITFVVDPMAALMACLVTLVTMGFMVDELIGWPT